MEFPEIKMLKSLQIRHHLKVGLASDVGPLLEVTLSTLDASWNLFVDDEYADFNDKRQLLCLFLVLRSLEDYNDEDDYFKWCALYGLNPAEDKRLRYYQVLAKTYREIVSVIGEPDSCINSLDYQLRSGAFSALLLLDE